MKFSPSFGILFMVAFVQLISANNSEKAPSSSSECKVIAPAIAAIPNKVKLTKATFLILNEKYYAQPYKYEVIKVNDTYNRLAVNYEIIKDFPLDVYFQATILRSDLECNNYEKIRDYIVPLCTNSTSSCEPYLRNTKIEDPSIGKCIVKGHYSYCDHGYFKFEELLSEKELRNAKFIVIRSTNSGHEILNQNKLEFASNLNTTHC